VNRTPPVDKNEPGKEPDPARPVWRRPVLRRIDALDARASKAAHHTDGFLMS